jgi:hypothetical protein
MTHLVSTPSMHYRYTICSRPLHIHKLFLLLVSICRLPHTRLIQSHLPSRPPRISPSSRDHSRLHDSYVTPRRFGDLSIQPNRDVIVSQVVWSFFSCRPVRTLVASNSGLPSNMILQMRSGMSSAPAANLVTGAARCV